MTLSSLFNFKRFALLLACALVLGACGGLNTARTAAGLPEYVDISGACDALEGDEAVPAVIADMGNGLACDAFSGLLAYEVAQGAILNVADEALASDERGLLEFAHKLGELEAKATPAAIALNRALGVWVYFEARVRAYERDGVPAPDRVLMDAAEAYAALSDHWRAARPIFAEISAAL